MPGGCRTSAAPDRLLDAAHWYGWVMRGAGSVRAMPGRGSRGASGGARGGPRQRRDAHEGSNGSFGEVRPTLPCRGHRAAHPRSGVAPQRHRHRVALGGVTPRAPQDRPCVFPRPRAARSRLRRSPSRARALRPRPRPVLRMVRCCHVRPAPQAAPCIRIHRTPWPRSRPHPRPTSQPQALRHLPLQGPQAPQPHPSSRPRIRTRPGTRPRQPAPHTPPPAKIPPSRPRPEGVACRGWIRVESGGLMSVDSGGEECHA